MTRSYPGYIAVATRTLQDTCMDYVLVLVVDVGCKKIVADSEPTRTNSHRLARTYMPADYFTGKVRSTALQQRKNVSEVKGERLCSKGRTALQ